jgi:hypothetical protein
MTPLLSLQIHDAARTTGIGAVKTAAGLYGTYKIQNKNLYYR